MKRLTIFLFLLIPIFTFSQIINIPDDYPTIQEGIDAANAGDTILVETGTYVENINFNGKNITVASHYLTTLDTSYISQTIIDGDSTGSVVRFENDETASAVLNGFTLTNGNAIQGGGIYCYQSNPTLYHLIVKNNISYHDGGGIYCLGSDLLLQNILFTGNSTDEGGGGGVAFQESNLTLKNVIITGNNSGSGGGIYCYESNANLENVSITYNSAKAYGGGIYNMYNSSLTFDEENRCNIYLNNAYTGRDIYSNTGTELILDSFTVLQPTEYHVYPLSNFSFDILHGKVEQVNADLYVSPDGDNNNSGLTESEPLKNIFYAFAKSIPDSIDPRAIHLADGIYSYTSNEEFFPVNLPECINLVGASRNGVIVDAEGSTFILRIQDNISNHVSGMTFTGGIRGISCHTSNLEFIDIAIVGNSAASDGFGLYCDESDLTLKNVIISGNSGGGLRCGNSNPMLENVIIANNSGIGFYCFDSNPIMKGVTIKNNWSSLSNGGGLFLSNSIPVFDTINRCNIFLNAAVKGNDIYSNNVINVVVDTFTVINPTGFNAAPFSNFSFDILNGKVEQVEADLYVSPDGDNNNSGLSAIEPIKNIHFGLTKMIADSIHPHTIHLQEGTYSPSVSGDFFPISLRDYISLSGESKEKVILDAEQKSILIYIDGTTNNYVTNMTIRNGGRSSSMYKDAGISCSNSSPFLEYLIITENNTGINCDNSDPLIKNVTISGNRKFGINCSNNSNAVIENAIIADNSNHGISCSISDPVLKNVIISDNSGSGLYCHGSCNPYLENVTISGNTGSYWDEIGNVGGGILLESNCNPVFDTVNRCNIYLNSAVVGNDIYSESQIQVVVDTFSVLIPTEFHAAPVANISFNILNGMVEQVDADLYVSEVGDDANSGLSEDDPLKTIHHAFLTMLVDTNNQNTVRLLPGTYSPSTTGELFPISLPDYYSLSGSSEEDVIVDAEGAPEVISISDNNYNWLSGMTITGSVGGYHGGIRCSQSDPILESLIITGNTACESVSGGNDGNGGGISCYQANPHISNTVIKNNTAALGGGGLNCSESSPILENVLIKNNTAERGGGISSSGNSFPVLKNVTITKNSSKKSGGGISCSNSFIIFDTLERCNIYDNGAGIGNDISAYYPLHVVVDTFTVLNPTNFHANILDSITFDILNAKYEQVSADLYVSVDGSETNSGLTAADPLQTIHHALSIIITDSLNPRTVNVLNGLYSPSTTNEFFPIGMPDFLNLQGESRDSTILDVEKQGGVIQISNNSSNTISALTIKGGLSKNGGGIKIYNASPVIQDVLLKDNIAWQSGGNLFCRDGNPVIRNSILGNDKIYGGFPEGLDFISSNPIFINSVLQNYMGFQDSEPTFINVTATDGFILNDGSHGMIINSIFSNKYESSGIVLGADGNQSKITISWSDILGGKEGIDGNGTIQWLEGNIDIEPLFTGNGDFPYSLQNGSPCINMGNPDTTGLNLLPFDLAGNPRLFGGQIEMGPYENQIIYVGITDDPFSESKYELRVYPNPFATSTTIEYQLTQHETVTITFYNQFGRQVDMIKKSQQKDLNQVVWAPENLANGIYYFRLQASKLVASGKVMLMR